MKTLRLILGDQLNSKHSWYKDHKNESLYCLFEMRQETDYITHHIQKVIGFFAAMRAFSEQLKAKGFQVIYFKIDDKRNTQNLTSNLQNLIKAHHIQNFEYQMPDEYRLSIQLKEFGNSLSINNKRVDTEHFYTSRQELKTLFKGKKQHLMESFYRYMRKKHQLLVVGDQPEGGKWNYDKSNRLKWKNEPVIPKYLKFDNKVTEIVEGIRDAKIKTIGHFNEDVFSYPINRTQALEQLKYFCEHLLFYFGDYQDAMHTNEVFLFHSRLSFAMNLKIVSPKDIINTVLNYWNKENRHIDISQIEGFVRQILGWREYMRGMYWALMPEYKSLNFLKNNNELPSFFWNGNTKMNCLKQAINNSLENGYAHHIQRLMVTGNYALLTQINPDLVDQWYLGIYIDAVEWVQLPNTRGMSQYADGGKIATKPYVSSGNYTNKMSNYCGECQYSHKEKITENACPFNSLYWNFLDDKKAHLKDNFRMKMMYRLLEKIKPEELYKIKNRAKEIIENPERF